MFFTSIVFFGFKELGVYFYCMFVSVSYVIEDCVKYIDSYSKAFNGTTAYQSLYDTSTTSNNLELTAKLKSTGNKGFGLLFSKTGSSTSNILREGVTGSSITHCTVNSGSDDTTTTGNTYSANSDMNIKIKIKSDNSYEAYIDNTLVKSGTSSVISQLRYVEIMSWNSSSQTVTITDLKIKPL